MTFSLSSDYSAAHPALITAMSGGKELPEDILLMIFQLLPWRDLLLGAGATCQHWRGLALHPALWRHLHLTKYFTTMEAITILKCAPCLGAVFLGEDPRSFAVLGTLLNSKCAINEFSVLCPTADANADVHSLLCSVLKRQVELQSLRRVSLELPSEGVCKLMAQLWNARILEMHIKMDDEQKDGKFCTRHVNNASLKRLTFECETEHWLLEELLEAHAATLEMVHIPLEASTRALRLLGKCFNLKDVEVPGRQEVACLKHCAFLQRIKICLQDNNSIDKLAAFLKDANNLKSLSFEVHFTFEDARVIDLLSALSSCRQCMVEELSLGDLVAVEQLPVFVCNFPRLRSLNLNVIPSEENLQNIGLFIVLLLFDERVAFSYEMCREHCFFPIVYRLVRQFPHMHVCGLPGRHFCKKGDVDDCDCCVQMCHPPGLSSTFQRHNGAVTHISLCGHQVDDCGFLPHHQNVCPAQHKILCVSHKWCFVGDA